MRRFTADESAEGMRADAFVTQKLTGYTRSSLSRLFEQGSVKVNKKTAKPGNKLRTGDKLTVDDKLLKIAPAPIDLPVIYEDDDVIVVDKPVGVLTHSKGALNEEATVASTLRDSIDISLAGNRAGIVHRLDRDTSGVIIVAKNEPALKMLQKQFSTRKVKKVYLALVEGRLRPAEAIIDAPIARNPQKPQTFVVSGQGKPAQTHYRVEKNLSLSGQDYSLVELSPATGRTHQLRVHMKYIGHPISGDPVYGHGGGMMLHAAELSISLPSGTKKNFRAMPPKAFMERLK